MFQLLCFWMNIWVSFSIALNIYFRLHSFSHCLTSSVPRLRELTQHADTGIQRSPLWLNFFDSDGPGYPSILLQTRQGFSSSKLTSLGARCCKVHFLSSPEARIEGNPWERRDSTLLQTQISVNFTMRLHPMSGMSGCLKKSDRLLQLFCLVQ